MSFKETIIDWLGRRIDDADVKVVSDSLSAQTYFKELAVYIAVSYIANTISKCEIKTYDNGEEVQDELYYLLNVNPNPNENSSQFMNHLIERYYYDGHALVVPLRNKLYVADGFSTKYVHLKDNVFESITVEDETLTRQYKANKVFYFKLDNREVISLVNGLYKEYGTVIASAINHFKKANSDKYKLIMDNIAAGDKDFEKKFNETITAQLRNFIDSDSAIYPQTRGYDLQRFDASGSASSADIINLRKEVFETVAQAFKIPLSMMQGNITNMNEIVKVYLSICIDPLAQMIGEELTRKTTDYDSWKAGTRVVVDTSKINHVDILEVADGIDKLIASGAFNIDQVLDRCGYDKLNTDFSQAHFLTKNYADINTATNVLTDGGGEQNGTA